MTLHKYTQNHQNPLQENNSSTNNFYTKLNVYHQKQCKHFCLPFFCLARIDKTTNNYSAQNLPEIKEKMQLEILPTRLRKSRKNRQQLIQIC